MKVEWEIFKTFIDQRNLSIQWVDLNNQYWMSGVDGNFSLECYLDKADAIEFESTYKDKGNQSPKTQVVTQYEVNDKDLKLAKMSCSIDETSMGLCSIQIPGVFGSSDGRYIAGGYGISEDFNRDDYILAWISDTAKNVAWAVALAQDPSASAPVDDSIIREMGIIPGIGVAFPNYPVIKEFNDEDVADENKGWYFWANARGSGAPANGEVEIEPIAGYGFLPAGFYLNIKYIRPAGTTTGGMRVNLFWGKKG